jgi:hypothetical protein
MISVSGWLFNKKSIMMHGNINVKRECGLQGARLVTEYKVKDLS